MARGSFPPGELLSRLNSPGGRWHQTGRCAGEMNSLKGTDEEAWFLINALLQDAVKLGLDPLDNREHPDSEPHGSYRCPVGRDIYRGIPQPPDALTWLGEIDVDGTTTVRGRDVHWRYYFMEPRIDPATEDDVLLGCSVRAKGIGAEYRPVEQTRQMRDAIEAGKRWCRHQKPAYAWRPSLWDSRQ